MADNRRRIDPGTAGASARREADRRLARYAAQAPTGLRGVARRLRGASPEDKRRVRMAENFNRGALGEERVAELLSDRCPEVPVLHDRRSPKARGNIDHIAVAPTGVWVIDTKRYNGKVEVRTPLVGKPTLRVDGFDKTRLVDGLAKQVGAVEDALGDLASAVVVRGCFCFVATNADGGVPLIRTQSINGFDLLYPRRLAKRLKKPGALVGRRADLVAQRLAARLPPA